VSTAEEKNKALIREITDLIWNQRQVERIPEFYSPDYVADYRPYAPERKGHVAIREMVERAHSTFPDYHEEVQQLVAEGDYVVVRLKTSGTQKGNWGRVPATGKPVEFEEIAILKIGDGKVVWQRGVVDNLSVLRQLGVVPTPPQETPR
jgi:predicted ester cyclase